MRVQDIKVTFEVQFLYFPPKVQSCAQLNDLKPTRTEPYIALELDWSFEDQIGPTIVESTKPPLDVLNAMNPPIKVQNYSQVDELNKEVKQLYMVEPRMMKSTMAKTCMPTCH